MILFFNKENGKAGEIYRVILHIFGKSNKEKLFIENKRNITKTIGYFYTLPDNSVPLPLMSSLV